jgi:hypothetical protein
MNTVAEVFVDMLVLAVIAVLTAGSIHYASGEKACQAEEMAVKPQSQAAR